MAEVTDERVAAWIREVNRGVPAWNSLDDEARKWWRVRYALHRAHGHITETLGGEAS